MINEDQETNNSQNSYENNNNNNNNNDLEDLLLIVLDELDTVKALLQEQGIVSQHQKPQPTTETLANKYVIAKELPRPPPQVLPNRNAHDFSACF